MLAQLAGMVSSKEGIKDTEDTRTELKSPQPGGFVNLRAVGRLIPELNEFTKAAQSWVAENLPSPKFLEDTNQRLVRTNLVALRERP